MGAELTAEAAGELFFSGPNRLPRNSLPMAFHTECLEFYWLPSALLTANALLPVLRPPGHTALSLSLDGHSFPLRLLDALVALGPLPSFPCYSVSSILAFWPPADILMSFCLFGVLLATR